MRPAILFLVPALLSPLHATRAQRAPTAPTAAARQLVVVTVPEWDATTGTLRRYERPRAGAPWRAVGAPVPVTVGHTGLAWGDGLHGAAPAAGPEKREGDGRAPAGVFRLSGAFGYAPPDSARWIRLPYAYADAQLECVDDPRSSRYNRLVRRDRVRAVDWSSSERMRLQSGQYRWGVLVDHNPGGRRRGGGSCIFLHIWRAPGEPTVGCTAMDEGALRELLAWLAPARRPVLVQLPERVYEELRGTWRLP